MRAYLYTLCCLLSLGFAAVGQAPKPAPTAAANGAPALFHRDVLPIFRTACLGCHNAQSPAGGLSLASSMDLLKGGRNGVPFTPGKASDSRLVQMLTGTLKPQMPPGGSLKQGDLDIIRKWIDSGAKIDAAIPEKGPRVKARMPGVTTPHPALLVTPSSGPHLNVAAPINALAFSPDGKVLAVGTYQRVLFYDVAAKQIIKTWPGHADSVRSLAFTKDGKKLAAGGGSPSVLGEVRIWDMTTGREVRAFGDHTDVVNALAFSPDEKTLATASSDKSLKIWDPATGKLLQTLRDHSDAVLGVAYHPNGKFLASCSADHSVKIWDTTSWKRLYSVGAHEDIVTDVEFTPGGGQFLTSSADATAKVWNFGPDGSNEARAFHGHERTVWGVTPSSDGKLAATAAADKRVKIWTLDNGNNTVTLQDAKDWVYAVRFSPDHTLLAGGAWDGTVLLWNVGTSKLVTSFTTGPQILASTKMIGSPIQSVKSPK